MDKSASLPRHERLRRRGAIRRLFDSGESGFVFPLRYMWFAEPLPSSEQASDKAQSATTAEVMFAVPKRFHKRANKRNLLRRRVKEAYRLQKSILLDSAGRNVAIDIALMYSVKEVKSYKSIENAVAKILANIAKEL